jgi:cytochrome c oxidase cbb3-type subunit 1
MMPRLLGTELVGARFTIIGAVVWNAALVSGVGALAVGINAGLEWL